ncbi:hypothetical protein BV25DRAFT_1187894 [Artomyces pyxidatus]|uniref:Uncharacterized protein n=1 Tax=Artomyces pyxidatus TaxID=48021 RepID=A0ACB8ST73_9AGAM|nr:hypothetical protein BV25DRAFT_1187894 [Artomyces pyxidatus]
MPIARLGSNADTFRLRALPPPDDQEFRNVLHGCATSCLSVWSYGPDNAHALAISAYDLTAALIYAHISLISYISGYSRFLILSSILSLFSNFSLSLGLSLFAYSQIILKIRLILSSQLIHLCLDLDLVSGRIALTHTYSRRARQIQSLKKVAESKPVRVQRCRQSPHRASPEGKGAGSSRSRKQGRT